MITTYLLNILLSSVSWLLAGLFAVIPDFNFLGGIQDHLTSAFSFFLGIVNFMNPIIPSSVTLSVLAVYLSFYSFYFGMKFISWILRKIPALGLS
jgi:hypothetical protein